MGFLKDMTNYLTVNKSIITKNKQYCVMKKIKFLRIIDKNTQISTFLP